MEYAAYSNPSVYSKDYTMRFPSLILAYDTGLSDEKIKEKMDENGDLVAICVIGKKFFLKQKEITIVEADSECSELFRFLASFYYLIINQQESRKKFLYNWSAYFADNE